MAVRRITVPLESCRLTALFAVLPAERDTNTAARIEVTSLRRDGRELTDADVAALEAVEELADLEAYVLEQIVRAA